MKLKALFTDEEAVSPVIGVILMVAITVILAAVIGTFVLGIGQQQNTTPNATWDFDYNGTGLEITHAGGDTFTTENTGELVIEASGGASKTITPTSGDPVDSSDSWELTTVGAGETVRIIWTAPGGGKTQTVGDFETPA